MLVRRAFVLPFGSPHANLLFARAKTLSCTNGRSCRASLPRLASTAASAPGAGPSDSEYSDHTSDSETADSDTLSQYSDDGDYRGINDIIMLTRRVNTTDDTTVEESDNGTSDTSDSDTQDSTTDDRTCRFCNNLKATGCAHGTCGKCCRMRPGSCARHERR